jgi:hypothetical protein
MRTRTKLSTQKRPSSKGASCKPMPSLRLCLLTRPNCREHRAFTLSVGVASVCPDQRAPRAFTSGHLEEERPYVMKGRGKRMREDTPDTDRDSSLSAGCSKSNGDEASARSIWIESDSRSAFAAVGGVPWPA